MSKRKISIITGSRAEYDLLRPVIRLIREDQNLEMQLIVTGMHLSPEFGMTKDIITPEFPVAREVEILLSSDSPVGISKSIGLAVISFSECFHELKPDLALVLGDRFEIFAAAAAAHVCRVPIAHIHGGETTSGAIDEAFRHAITKMAMLHFTSTEEYKNRVIQLGEHPERVFNVGALGVENIRSIDLLDASALSKELRFDVTQPYGLVTFHPVTLEQATSEEQFDELLSALDAIPDMGVIFTKANADTEGRIINQKIKDYVAMRLDRAKVFTSLGMVRYLSAMKHCTMVIGNSSSGIIEAPSFNVPTIDIGDRQKGRVRADSVIHCDPNKKEISESIKKALSQEFLKILKKSVNPYEKPRTSRAICSILSKWDITTGLKKSFYDLREVS